MRSNTAKFAAFVLATFVAVASDAAAAFVPHSVAVPSRIVHKPSVTLKVGYVPDGMTPEQWKKMKNDEKKKKQSLNFAQNGPRGFRSRSLQSFQEDLERGKVEHLLPMTNAKRKIKEGKIKAEDIPYMQRGGSWDNADVKGAKKREWSKTDKKYAGKAPQSPGLGVDWTGKQARKGPSAQRQAQSSSNSQPKKKFLGLF